METRAAKRWIVKGLVQGVGFRFFVQHKAASLGLTGWARNLDDGSVEVYATGPQARLEDLSESLKTGPRVAEVSGVEEHEDAVQKFSIFSIR